MLILLKILFWGSWLGLLHTYVFYPFLLKILAAGQRLDAPMFNADDPELPTVSVLMSLYNEEKVIAEKLGSLLALDYPPAKLRFFIGSDCSSDRTADIIQAFVSQFPIAHFQFQNFPTRRGKPPVINDLAAAAFQTTPPGPNHVLLLTDASVMLRPDTLFHLVKHFKNPRVGVVDAHMQSEGLRAEGISRSEHQYVSGEVRLKHHEGLAWGCMIGPFGGCYALRSDLFEPVPPNFLVDDFYLTFKVLAKNFQALNDLDAICFEGATHRVKDEFRRKKRIAAGSFQNLWVFRRWVSPPVTRLGFAFFSHKVLRWFGGFLLLLAWVTSAVLAGWAEPMYRWIFASLTLGLLGAPALDWLLRRLGLHVLPIKSAAYFVAMNVALIAGFFQWRRGIQSNVWQPTPRA